jgi:cytochrome b561
MQAKAAGGEYRAGAKWLHWIIGLAVLGMIPVGVIMANRAAANIFDDTTNMLYTWHKSIGFTVLWLMVVRVIYKLRNPPPAPAPTLTPLERIASVSVHHLLYILLFIVPILGWAGVSAFDARGTIFGFDLPAILPKNEKRAEFIFTLHKIGAITIGLLALAHIGGAAMHGVIKQDGVLNRMIGWWPLRK